MSNATIETAKVELPLKESCYLLGVMDGLCKRLTICSNTDEYREAVAVYIALEAATNETKKRIASVIETGA